MFPSAHIFLRFVLLLAALNPVAARAAESGDAAHLVDINGGRKMYLDCRGAGSPTVVLIAGLKGSAEDWNTAEKQTPTVFSEVAQFTRVCAYDRPGTPVGEKPSRSDPVQQPTTAQDAVLDLHACCGPPRNLLLTCWWATPMAVSSPDFMPVLTPTRYPVLSSSTLSLRSCKRRRCRNNGRCSGP